MRLLLHTAALTVLTATALAQDESTGFAGTAAGKAPRVEIAWNRLYDVDEIYAHLDRLVAAYPERLRMHPTVGHSVQNRDLRVYVLNNPETGLDTEKPAMWIDGNVHGNEVQGAEAVLYTAWYLLENYGTNERVTELVDRAAFYLLPMQNPDGRANWFAGAHTASSSRSGYQPVDSDRDGVPDEDGPDDLDGDGHITSMRKRIPGEGTHRLDPDDPRVLVRVPADTKGARGDWVMLGREGIDNDGDGRINEDGPGGYDMNRAWPSMWQPGHVQFGAGPYPLYWPETRFIAGFILDHPNIAAVQSFHNAGGMILRGPGAASFGSYPRADVRVYDEIGRTGEKMLPFYRYMILWKDLYTVFGGFVTWTYEGLGIISFTNEMWSRRRQFPDANTPAPDDRHFFDDHLLMGDGFIDWKPFDHPRYGPIEIGGFKKDVGRVPPSFLIEEETHRNALFCLVHAEAMPEVVIENVVVGEGSGGVRTIDVEFRNLRAIPTRSARTAEQKIGTPDRFSIEGVEVLAGGFRTDRFRPEAIELAEREPERLLSENGVGGRGVVRVRWFVRGRGEATIRFEGEKASNVSREVTVR
ncbi:MAG: peptidase M14 [bacterium]|nr:peptidase M14 [bacterium]